MTKKHFEAIAVCIDETRRYYEGTHGQAAVVEIAKGLAIVCAGANPRFDQERFLRACGILS